MSLDFAELVGKVTVADGGWSTILRARGAPLNAPAELANLSHPHLIEELACDYLAAGATLLSTNTFAANRLVFEQRGVAASVAEVNTAGAQLVVRAAQRFAAGASAAGGRKPPARAARAASRPSGLPIRVGGTIGPSGKMLVVRERGEEEIAAAFAEQARALAVGGVDFILLETFSELAEVLLALRAVRAAVSLPVVASMSFDSGPQHTQTVMGVEAAAAAVALSEAGADAIGSNCGAGIASALPAVVALCSNTTRPVWCRPSVGPPDLDQGRPVYPQTPDEFGAHVAPLLDAGVSVIGGCCGVGPEHIRRLAAISAHRKRA